MTTKSRVKWKTVVKSFLFYKLLQQFSLQLWK